MFNLLVLIKSFKLQICSFILHPNYLFLSISFKNQNICFEIEIKQYHIPNRILLERKFASLIFVLSIF